MMFPQKKKAWKLLIQKHKAELDTITWLNTTMQHYCSIRSSIYTYYVSGRQHSNPNLKTLVKDYSNCSSEAVTGQQQKNVVALADYQLWMSISTAK